MTDAQSKLIRLDFVFKKNYSKQVKVIVGVDAIKQLSTAIAPLKPDKVFVVCDTHIAKLYLEDVKQLLAGMHDVHTIIHQPNESNKKLETVSQISSEFFAHGGSTRSVICTLGGGVTANMVGLFASIAYRGVPLVNIPTTLMSQVDSAADVKHSVNSERIKNAIGSYKAPDLVIIDPNFLKSLSPRGLRAGIGEAVKHGLSQDMKFVDFLLEADYSDPETLKQIAATTVSLKIDHWNHMPTMWNDTKFVRRLTHLGHVTGKIFEMIHIDYLTHGEAISHGMVIETYASYLMGHIDLPSVEKMRSVLHQLELLYPLNEQYTIDAIMDRLYGESEPPLFALLTGLGNPRVLSTEIPPEIYRKAVSWYLSSRV
jgi:3-dehydroquinate synthase